MGQIPNPTQPQGSKINIYRTPNILRLIVRVYLVLIFTVLLTLVADNLASDCRIYFFNTKKAFGIERPGPMRYLPFAYNAVDPPPSRPMA